VKHWLIKSEPGTFSISDLEKSPGRTTLWDGVRNYQARNSLREMKKGDRALFYHSNAEPSGVVGTVEVVREAYPDPTALDPADPHFDPKSTEADPIWSVVDVKHVATFARCVELATLKKTKGLEKMAVVQKGTRLSVTPVTDREFEIVVALGAKA
jgi:predicted RNA-binding protein with PUA-like domain